MMQPDFTTTLGNVAWLAENESAIKETLPEQWTPIVEFGQAGALKVGFKLKLLGVDWRSQQEFGKIMVYLEKIGFMQRDGMMIRRNPASVFPVQAVAMN
jgi:hypothetical protein